MTPAMVQYGHIYVAKPDTPALKPEEDYLDNQNWCATSGNDDIVEYHIDNGGIHVRLRANYRMTTHEILTDQLTSPDSVFAVTLKEADNVVTYHPRMRRTTSNRKTNTPAQQEGWATFEPVPPVPPAPTEAERTN